MYEHLERADIDSSDKSDARYNWECSLDKEKKLVPRVSSDALTIFPIDNV